MGNPQKVSADTVSKLISSPHIYQAVQHINMMRKEIKNIEGEIGSIGRNAESVEETADLFEKMARQIFPELHQYLQPVGFYIDWKDLIQGNGIRRPRGTSDEKYLEVLR